MENMIETKSLAKTEPSTEVGYVYTLPEPPNTSYCYVRLNGDANVKIDTILKIIDKKKTNATYVVYVTEIIDNVAEDPRLLLNVKSLEPGAIELLLESDKRLKVARCEYIALLQDGKVCDIDTPPTPFSKAYIAGNEVGPILGFVDSSKGLVIGELANNPEIKVVVDPNKLFSMHAVIVGMTGRGKSYLVGVIVEEACRKGIPVLVIDPEGEYKTMAEPNDNQEDVKVLRERYHLQPQALEVKHLVPGENIFLNPYDVLQDPLIIEEYLGATPKTMNALKYMIRLARDENVPSGELLHYLKVLLEELYEASFSSEYGGRKRWKNDIKKHPTYHPMTLEAVERLLDYIEREWNAFLKDGYDIYEIIRPGVTTILDVSDVSSEVAMIFVADILRRLYKEKKRGDKSRIPPTVVIIEEAQRLLPRKETPASKRIIDLIRRGRRRGVGIVLVSQRPVRLHADAVSVANTSICFRLKGRDLEYIGDLMSLSKEELRAIPRLPRGVCIIDGPVVTRPLRIKVRPRMTKHGGATVPFIL